jgi:hypothetical protein
MDSRPNTKISSKVVAKTFETSVEAETSCNSAFESECLQQSRSRPMRAMREMIPLPSSMGNS